MLKREQAQAALAEFTIDNWWESQQETIASLSPQLSPQLQKLAKVLRVVDINHYRERDKAIRQVEALDTAARSHLFTVIFPSMGEVAQHAYDEVIPALPYQTGYARRAFRSHKSEHHRERQYVWLRAILDLTQPYVQPVEWYAVWAAHISSYSADQFGILFAAAIDRGGETGDRVFETLCDSARGEHEIGAMGRHVTRSLLIANRPEGWQLMENMLVAAQQQAGLRQVILETIDEAHPRAFVRMLRVIVEQNLVRFSATVRAADVWFGLGWDVEQQRSVQANLEQLLSLLESSEQQDVALQSTDPTAVYVGLWALAFEDIERAIAAAKPLLQHARAEHRFVAAYLLRQIGVSEVVEPIAPVLADDDLRVAVQAFRATRDLSAGPLARDWFERLDIFLQRFSAKTTKLEPLVWPWIQESVTQGEIAEQMWRVRGDRPVNRMLPYLPLLSEWVKLQVAEKLVKAAPWDEEVRAAILKLVGDRSGYVREGVLNHLNRHGYTPDATDAPVFESLLTRKAADLRRGLIGLLLKQTDAAVMTSADRLLNASKAPQRLAGLELLDQMQQNQRMNCRQQAQAYIEKRAKRTASEQELLDRLLAAEQDVPTLSDALGLSQPNARTPALPPSPPDSVIPLVSESTEPILRAIDQLLTQHRTTPVTVHYYDRTEEVLLGNAQWLSTPQDRYSREENLARFPLGEVWRAWWESRPNEMRDEDGLELLRVRMAFTHEPVDRAMRSHHRHFFGIGETVEPQWAKDLQSKWFTHLETSHSRHIDTILTWLSYVYAPDNAAETLLNAAQFVLAEIDGAAREAPATLPYDWRKQHLLKWLHLARQHRRKHSWTSAQATQLWQLLRWVDQPDHASMVQFKAVDSQYGNAFVVTTDGDGFVQRKRPNLDEVVAAWAVGAATHADMYDHLIGERFLNQNFHDLQQLTRRKPHPLLTKHSPLVEIVKACRDHILSIELTRGDLPTAATAPALSLSAITGTPIVLKMLQNFGSEKFARGWLRDSQSKSSVFSHLFRVSFPDETDTPAAFAKQVKATKIKPQRLIELAVYAPQWARYVEHALKWKNLTEAVWWFHAHTKDNAWQVPAEIRDLWTAQIAELTPLSSQDLIDGAVDVAWFQRIYKRLSAERWAQVNDAAKYASGGGGHKRAQLFAEAMTGQTDRAALIERIQDKRHQDSVRALGLMPLAGRSQSKKWKADVLERYEIIQDFLRTSRQFGSQRQASEKLAARIAMENLARTAGFVDPQRLEWAMEKAAIADLAKGPATVEIGEVSISLSLSEQGEPNIRILKKGKSLKNVPAKLKKDPGVQALQARKRSITRQANRIRGSLEAAMCRGDEFTGAELKDLLTHPILRPALSQLVFIEAASGSMGYPTNKHLLTVEGAEVAIAANMRLRIAHPVDFAASKQWHLWQQQCFASERVQPFKQIFRELYVLTSAEQQDTGTGGRLGSVRYAGHQVNPRQALALLGQRGWVAHPEEGIRRTFHDENLLVWLEFEEGWYTPSNVEGFTLDQVCFSDRKTYKPIALADIPPKVFSEVMRDLDLVVSVAHQGGVDPEASASTVEMRAALLRETTRLFSLENVELQAPYALIEGSLGSYTLHLGSAVIHRQPGGALCIVPVRSQHRGRLFLPFADDDPKTAEVVSKALLLARDHKIQDPTILEQLL